MQEKVTYQNTISFKQLYTHIYIISTAHTYVNEKEIYSRIIIKYPLFSY